MIAQEANLIAQIVWSSKRTFLSQVQQLSGQILCSSYLPRVIYQVRRMEDLSGSESAYSAVLFPLVDKELHKAKR